MSAAGGAKPRAPTSVASWGRAWAGSSAAATAVAAARAATEFAETPAPLQVEIGSESRAMPAFNRGVGAAGKRREPELDGGSGAAPLPSARLSPDNPFRCDGAAVASALSY